MSATKRSGGDAARDGQMANAGARRVRVTVNGKTEAWHLGLKVKHAIGARWARKVRARRALVADPDGNRYDLEGALFDGQVLLVRDCTPEEYWADVLR